MSGDDFKRTFEDYGVVHPNPDPGWPPPPGEDWCYSHNRSEPIPEGGAYRVCGECGHCWLSQEDLMADVIKSAQECGADVWPLGPQFVYFCPLCIHDF